MVTAVTSLPSVPVTFIYNPYTMLLEFISKDHLKDMLNQLSFCQRSLFTCPNHNLFSAVWNENTKFSTTKKTIWKLEGRLIVGEPQKVLWYHDIHKILPDKYDNTFSRIMEITPLIDKWFWGYHMGCHFSRFQSISVLTTFVPESLLDTNRIFIRNSLLSLWKRASSRMHKPYPTTFTTIARKYISL